MELAPLEWCFHKQLMITKLHLLITDPNPFEDSRSWQLESTRRQMVEMSPPVLSEP